MSRQGHPLPGSDEARHNEIPENLEREKGRGGDSKAAVQPQEAVTPEGKRYRYDDLGRGPGPEKGPRMVDKVSDDEVKSPRALRGHEGHSRSDASASRRAKSGPDRSEKEFADDQSEHQDRGQSISEAEADAPDRLN